MEWRAEENISRTTSYHASPNAAAATPGARGCRHPLSQSWQWPHSSRRTMIRREEEDDKGEEDKDKEEVDEDKEEDKEE